MTPALEQAAARVCLDYEELLIKDWEFMKQHPHWLRDKITFALRAVRVEVLEEAWKAGASIVTTGVDSQHVQDRMLAALRSLMAGEQG